MKKTFEENDAGFLGYALSKSMRIPDFTIDGKGVQPDYYLDKSIPLYEWTKYVNKNTQSMKYIYVKKKIFVR